MLANVSSEVAFFFLLLLLVSFFFFSGENGVIIESQGQMSSRCTTLLYADALLNQEIIRGGSLQPGCIFFSGHLPCLLLTSILSPSLEIRVIISSASSASKPTSAVFASALDMFDI